MKVGRNSQKKIGKARATQKLLSISSFHNGLDGVVGLINLLDVNGGVERSGRVTASIQLRNDIRTRNLAPVKSSTDRADPTDARKV
jgi:hypothetical protein